ALMARHVDRGEGKSAFALLPLLENTSNADEARKIALMAARQYSVPIQEESRLMKARLKSLAPNGSRPTLRHDSDYGDGEYYIPNVPSWRRIPRRETEYYSETLSEYTQRLDHLDRSHQTSVSLILGEMDRMPDAEELWMHLSSQLESWKLDDALGPRYLQALQRFKGEGIWPRLARWYAKRNYNKELRELADTLTSKFRGVEIFARIQRDDIHIAIPEQPPIRDGVRMVPWADWVRFKALERFPHSPHVVSEAQKLVTQSVWRRDYLKNENMQNGQNGSVVIPDALMQTKQWAIFFVDADTRELWFQDVMRKGSLAQKLEAIEAREPKTPVDNIILCEGWSRLSHYEKAVAAAERLTDAYPGDENMAAQALSLYRSLGGLGRDYTKAAHALVARVAPALENPYNLWTELGEMEEESGRPSSAIKTWQALLEREPRSLSRISDLATLLWDYSHDREALNVIEEGRKKMNKPGILAFEAGVLWENLRDIDRAIGEYMNALRQNDNSAEYYSYDQRALGRIAQLITRQRVYSIVERNIQALKPGQAGDERRLLDHFPLAFESASNQLENDDWIDFINSPNDPIGRSLAAQKRTDERPASESALRSITSLILAKAVSMSSKATSLEFLEACQTWVRRVTHESWKPDQLVSYENTLMARRAELVPSTEERIRIEIERADFLASNNRNNDAQAVWSVLETLITSLPDGAAKMKAEVARASFLENTDNPAAAAAEWKRLGERYPWSYGLLEERLTFLRRTKALVEHRALLEDASNRAAEGFRLSLLQQLARQSLSENDNERALATTQRILLESGLSQDDRLEAVEILARLSIRNNRTWEPLPFAREQSAMFNQDHLPDMYHRIAIAADSEGSHKTALWMWVEALNRRLDRQWLKSACRSAMTGGVEKELLSHFERQQRSSPRDVRWAVAVRDICRNLFLVDQTIRAAKSAVSINPANEELWRDAVEIMVLADKSKEAADYLEGSHKLRPADESTATWRSKLYARAGEAEQAFAIERATLDAFQKITQPTGNFAGNFDKRRARAAVRLMENGLVTQALRIYSQQGDILATINSEIPRYQQARLAIYSGQLIKLLNASTYNSDMLNSIANELNSNGKVEDRETVINHLLPQFSDTLITARTAALGQWHDFIRRSGLSGALRLASAQMYVSKKPGPWQSNPPVPFLQKVGEILIPDSFDAIYLIEPNLELMWMLDLARRDKSEELLAFIQPAWKELTDLVFGYSNLDSHTIRLKKMLENQLVLETWARAASKNQEIMKQLNSIIGDELLWERFQSLVSLNQRQQAEVLFDLVTPEARAAFSHFGENALMNTGEQYQAGQKLKDRTALAIGRLIFDRPGSADDPIIAKLRGPQTVGEFLSTDVRWIWPEFTPYQGASGDIDSNRGVDIGRFPAALWSQSPSEPWYVLETLARYRKGDRAAPLLPLESRVGSEAERLRLSVNIARSMGDTGMALELDARRPISVSNSESDARRAQTRIQLLNADGKHEEAIELWKAYIISRQKVINSLELADLTQFAHRNNLPNALGLIDASQSLHPEFMATLVNSDVSAFKSYKTPDAAAFRYALSRRWIQDETNLSAAQTRFWLRELWATDSIGLPYSGLSKLGGLWPHACQWLLQQPVPKRLEALNVLEAGGTTLIKLLQKDHQNDAVQMLTARVWLTMGDQASGLALLDKWIAENRHGDFAQASATKRHSQDEYDTPQYYQYDSPLVDRVRYWSETLNVGRVHSEATSRLFGMLKSQCENGHVSGDVWALAFELCAPESKNTLLDSLDRAWFMGYLDSENMGSLVETLAKHAPKKAPQWLNRWPLNGSFQRAKQRANAFVALKQPKEAAKVYIAARQFVSWSMDDDLSAFNEWRRLDVGSQGPELWQSAFKIWKGNSKNTLTAQLKDHPLDCYSAAYAIETAQGAAEDELIRVEQAI
ncbi:MAG: tetratricopeptide repeat protein, partial [Holophagales bacterium]|nr:tetratricopeptide repeat protein [Holophagales bacterium]